METTKSKISKGIKQTANSEKQPRPVCQISKTTLFRVWLSLTERKKDKDGKAKDSYLETALKATSYGTYKLTLATPECKEDIKGSIVVGDKKFYLVPSSVGLKGIFSAIISYFDVLDAQRVWAKKLANTKSFEDWVVTADAQRQFRAAEFFKGSELTKDEKYRLYKVYLNDRGIEEKKTAK